MNNKAKIRSRKAVDTPAPRKAKAALIVGKPEAKPKGKDLDTELRLGFLLHDVSRLRRNIVDRAVKPLSVTRSQWWVLAFLSRQDGMSQVELASDLDLGKVALGGLIDRLELNGLVERRADDSDRRIKHVFLTPKGSDLIKLIRESVRGVEKEMLYDIKVDDLNTVIGVLRSMKRNLLDLLGSDRAQEQE